MKELNFLIFGDDSLRKTCRFNGLNQYPYSFFEAAFREIGSSNYRVIIETTNKEMFIIPAQNDPDFVRWRSKFSLSYEIVLPLEDKYNWGKLKPLLQEDVNRFFGRMFGIEGLFEKRKYMAYVLVKTEEGSLETNGGSRSYYGPGSNGYKKNEGVSMIKCPYSAITSTLSIFEDMATGHPFIDETGIDKNMLVDFKLTGDITDINNVRPQLKQYGLDIIEAEREVEVLVIRDKVKE